MAGYDYSNWKSNNAVEAEDRGLVKAGTVAHQFGVSAAAVASEIWPTERHHVSGGFNLVGYYDFDRITDQHIERCRKFDSRHTRRSILSATVEFLEWPNFKVGRYAKNDSAPTKHEIAGCRVTFKTAATLVITTPSGQTLTKRTSTRGLKVTDELEGVVALDNSEEFGR